MSERKIKNEQIEGLKALRKMCKNKIEYDKAKSFYLQYGRISILKNGTFHEKMNLWMIGLYEPEIEDISICMRCGKCCELQDKDGNLTGKLCGLCKYDKETEMYSCLLYNNPSQYKVFLDEKGVVPVDEIDITKNNRCMPRVWSSRIIEGCPYNDQLEGIF